MSKLVSIPKALELQGSPDYRTVFLSDIELQSYGDAEMDILYGILDIIELRKQIIASEGTLYKPNPRPLPIPVIPERKPCPRGIWPWPPLRKFIIDDSKFVFKDYRIEYNGEDLVKGNYELKKIEGTDFQLIEVTKMNKPLSMLKLRSKLPVVTLVIEGEINGKNKTVVLDQLQISPF